MTNALDSGYWHPGPRLSSSGPALSLRSKGGLSTPTETYEGKRIQKFVYKGMAPVRSKDQGALWPTTSG
jgi:hypothetical protein